MTGLPPIKSESYNEGRKELQTAPLPEANLRSASKYNALMSGRRRRRHEDLRLSKALLIRRPLKPRRYEGAFAYKYRNVEHLEWLKEILLDDRLYFRGRLTVGYWLIRSRIL
jgi:hypothetical protein